MSVEQYDELTRKVDEFHTRVRARYPSALVCASGCSRCCQQHLTLLPFEFQRLTVAAEMLGPEARRELRERLERCRSERDCVLLDALGRCSLYEARPIICRSHGLPIQLGTPPVRDICPHNLPQRPPVDELASEFVLDVDRINMILVLLDRLPAGGDGQRIDLFDGLKALVEHWDE